MTKVILGSHKTSGVPEFAGSTWVRLQYMLGLDALGVEAYWVDRLPRVDPVRGVHSLDYLTARFARLMRRFGLEDRYCVVYDGGEQHFGLDGEALRRLSGEADLLLNISGHLPPDSPLMEVPRRAYIDVDPGFTQIWAHEVDMGFDRHTHFFTIGQTVGTPDFDVPLRGIDWRRMRPPVALREWPARVDERFERFSTVADWRGSQEAIYEGTYYGGKRSEFVGCLRLPLVTGERFELALCIGQHDHEDLGLLDGHGWKVRDFAQHAGDVDSYREFVQRSRAEFSVAKAGYVRSGSGWVSDRTACYLASGKPALVQSTGFEGHLPTGEGLLTFRTPDEAAEGVRAINADYPAHARAARRIAEEHFDAEKVLTGMLTHAGVL